MSIYMYVPGIEGDVIVEGYNGWIALTMIEFDIKHPLHNKIGNGYNRSLGIATASEILVSKPLDKTSPLFFREACVGSLAKPTVEIDFCSGNNLYLKYTLYNVLFSGFDFNYDQLHENEINAEELLTLNFTSIEKRYFPYDSNGKQLAPIADKIDVPSVRSAAINTTMNLHYDLITPPFLTKVPLSIKLNLLSYLGNYTNFNDHFNSNQMANMSRESIVKSGTAGLIASGADIARAHIYSSTLLRAVKRLRPTICRKMPKNGGVLVSAVYNVSRAENTVAMNLVSIYPATSGMDYKKLIVAEKNKSFITSTPSKGSSRMILYVWVTR